MATATVTEFQTRTVFTTSTSTSTSRASSQAGIIAGANPAHYDPSNPVIMFIIQAAIVISFCRLLHVPLSKLRQPRVVAEVVAGILLGPSVMGRVPGFTKSIFPTASMPNFTLVANIGLILFLFLVGLEVDLRYVRRNWRVALSVGFGGMILPFGLGCALSWGLYYQFRTDTNIEPISFPVYMLFIGVATAITAFPVLCRILTELKLLGTHVGIVVLAAGVANDVVGWVLLALCVALVNSGTGLVALWIVLACTGYSVFLIFAVRPAFIWLLKKTGNLDNGPSQAMLSITLLLTFSSAFFTGVIGVHPIFGAFMVGLICPKGQFSIKVAEKTEDLVNSLFLPLYFALSGLSTNLALLNNGITWAYVIAVIATAFFSKVVGGTLAARLNGLQWRESFTIGALMSCKGLVELIVLNIGLQARILSQRTFTIFVIMALVTTFATTPITAKLYPVWYQKQLELESRESRLRNGDTSDGGPSDHSDNEKGEKTLIRRILVHFRLDNMPELLAFVSLFGKSLDKPGEQLPQYSVTDAEAVGTVNCSTSSFTNEPVDIHGVRMLHLTERVSSVMKLTEAEQEGEFDPVVNAVKAIGRLHNISVSGEVAASTDSHYATTLVSRALDNSSDLLLLPWSANGQMDDTPTPFSASWSDRFAEGPYKSFICETLNHTECNIGVFINNGFSSGTRPSVVSSDKLSRTFSAARRDQTPNVKRFTKPFTPGHRVLVAYFGGPDDRLAVRLALQLARNGRVSTKIVHFKVPATDNESQKDKSTSIISRITQKTISKAAYGAKSSANTKLETTTRTTITETTTSQQRHAAFLATMRSCLCPAVSSRVVFESVSCTEPMRDVVRYSQREFPSTRDAHSGDLILMGHNRSMGLGEPSELPSPLSASVSSPSLAPMCLGPIGKNLLDNSVDASLLIIRAATS